MHETTQRLYQYATEKLGISEPGRLAARLNVSNQTIGNWVSRGMSHKAMLEAEKKIGVSARWLAEGGESTPDPLAVEEPTAPYSALPVNACTEQLMMCIEGALGAVGLQLETLGTRESLFNKISLGLLQLSNVKKSAIETPPDPHNPKRHARSMSENMDAKLTRLMQKKSPAGKAGDGS